MKDRSFVLIILLSLSLLISACNPVAAEQAVAAPPLQEIEQGVPVETTEVISGNISLVLNYAGELVPAKDVQLVPRVAGQIVQVLVEEGDSVKAGDPIVLIERDVYQAQLEQAEAALSLAQLKLEKMEQGARPEELAAARAAVEIVRSALDDVKNPTDDYRTTAAANLAKAQAGVRLAQAEYDKIAWAGQVGESPQALALEKATTDYEASLAAYNLQTHPTASKTAPLEAEVVKAELDLKLAEQPFRPVDFEMAKAGLKQAEAALALAQLQLDYTALTAPFDGVVAELYIDEGSMVSSGGSVARLVAAETEVRLNVEESRLSQLYQGQHVALQVSAYPEVDFPAVVTNIAVVADAKSHTFKVTVKPQDEKGLLRGGMFADVSLLAEEKTNTLLVPLAAVTELQGQPVVYIVSENNTVEQRPVTTGLSNKQQIEILSGLKAGDKVVVAGQSNLQDGVNVKVVPNL